MSQLDDEIVRAQVVDEGIQGLPPVRRPTVPRESAQSPPPPAPTIRLAEVCAVVALVGLADATIFHGRGFAGYALLFATAPWLLWLGVERPQRVSAVWIVLGMLTVAAIRLVWCGSLLTTFCGAVLIVALAMTLHGQRPYLLELLVFASQTGMAGYFGLLRYWKAGGQLRPRTPGSNWINLLLPLVTVLVFGTLFILANPDLATAFGEGFDWFVQHTREWLFDRLPTPLQVLFWAVVAWVVVGLLRPLISTAATLEEHIPRTKSLPREAPLFIAYRNTLVLVIALFALYLLFEFWTLWRRDFPPGFYYSGYAHEGAAWLTVALALATVILSFVFRDAVLADPRLPRLRQLAWIWSAQNLLLAIAVYNRLFIYIGFNGMTPMRVVGLFGMSAVVAGFILVLMKIARNHDFAWLVRRHLWVLAITIYLFALTPVDAIVCSYNVRRVLAGDLAPSVQISVHPISAEGILLLRPLLECNDVVIHEGVRAMLAERQARADALAATRSEQGWTAFQWSERVVWHGLRADADRWREYRDVEKRSAAIKSFQDYAYQWY